MDSSLEKQAASLFQGGNYEEAVVSYTTCLEALAGKTDCGEVQSNLLINRSVCFFKMKQYDKVVEDCDSALLIHKDNSKVLARKIKALCNLGRFVEAHQVAQQWKQLEPQGVQAPKELERLDIILKAMQDQDVDEDVLDDNIIAGERIPPEGREAEGKTQSPSNVLAGLSNAPSTSAPAGGKSTVLSGKVGPTTSSATEVKVDQPSINGHATVQSPVKTAVVIANGSAGSAAVPEIDDEEDKSNSGASGGKAFQCTYCGINFMSRTELRTHCQSDLHKKKVSSDEGREWKHRPPPRGLTSDEYTKCPRYFGEGTCRFGTRCSQAHSDAELAEWKDRFEYKKQRVQMAKDSDLQCTTFVDQLWEKWINAENKESVMVDNLEGVHVHINSDLSLTMSSKRCSSTWTFTVTSKLCLKLVALLDDSNWRHFYISSITVGPKRSQSVQKIDDHCQEWVNPVFNISRACNEKVYRVKINFRTDIYGTFRQSVVFDFGTDPVLARQICVDSTPVTDVDRLNQDLKKKKVPTATLR